jgi:hypothetical protein
MYKTFCAVAVFIAVLASCLFGGGAVTSAGAAAVSFVAWPKDVVYVYDTTANLRLANGSPLWPVRAAAARWSAGNPVAFRYTTKPCPAGSQCVVVRQAELAAPAVGSTATARVGNTITSSTVILDRTFGKTTSATHRQNVVCHELGHSIGLGHRAGTSSCMTSYVTNQRYPAAADITLLKTMYGSR